MEATFDMTNFSPDEIIRHEYRNAFIGGPPELLALEYLLPANSIPDEVRDALDPWIRRLIGCQPAEIDQILVDRWKHLKRRSQINLRDRICEASAYSILIENNVGWVSVVHAATDRSAENMWYIPAPLPLQNIERLLASSPFASNAALIEFLVAFAGLSEHVINGGSFILETAQYLTDKEPHAPDPMSDLDWLHSLILFKDNTGNRVVLHSNGTVGYWLIGEGVVQEIATNLDSFIESFVDYNRRFGCWLNPHQPDYWLRSPSAAAHDE
jgi:hypothetical protein